MKTRSGWIMVLMLNAGMAQATFVTIGNPDNAGDGGWYGAVSYAYKISSTEVTIAEMAASGAGSGNEGYWNDDATTSSGRTVGAGAPASYVSLNEAMKYCNYLTSGSVNDGVYTFSGEAYQSTLSRSAIMAGGLDAVATDPNKIYALPTHDEWYKAAYWTGLGYSDYANGNDEAPPEGGSTTGWNYSRVNASPNYTRDAALGTTEQNGTVNMMGNVWEWLESFDDSDAIIRGGSYNGDSDYLSSRTYGTLDPSVESLDIGLRIVEVVPEPASSLSLVLGSLVVAGCLRIRKSYGL